MILRCFRCTCFMWLLRLLVPVKVYNLSNISEIYGYVLCLWFYPYSNFTWARIQQRNKKYRQPQSCQDRDYPQDHHWHPASGSKWRCSSTCPQWTPEPSRWTILIWTLLATMIEVFQTNPRGPSDKEQNIHLQSLLLPPQQPVNVCLSPLLQLYALFVHWICQYSKLQYWVPWSSRNPGRLQSQECRFHPECGVCWCGRSWGHSWRCLDLCQNIFHSLSMSMHQQDWEPNEKG